MYKHVFLSPDFAKCRAYVIRLRIKWPTKLFYTHAVYGRNISGY